LNSNFSETAFLHCFSNGDIIAFDLGVKKHLYLDGVMFGLMRLNIFKNLLCLNKNFSDNLANSKEGYLKFDYSYNEILKNIIMIDFSKIVDLKNQDQNKLILIKKLNNSINLNIKGNCIIEIFKRNINVVNSLIKNMPKNFILLDVKFDFSKITKVDFRLDIANQIFIEESKKTQAIKNSFIPTFNNLFIIQKEKEFFKKFLKNVRYVSYNYKFNTTLIIKNLKILEDFSEEYFNTDSPTKSAGLYTSICKYFKNNKIEIKNVIIKINFWNRLLITTVFLSVFVAIYQNINLLNDEMYTKANYFIDFSSVTIMLKYYTLILSHSYFSINLIMSDLELSNFTYFSNTYDNSIKFHFDLIKNRADNFLENSYKFQNLYNTYGSYLLAINDTVYENFLIEELNSDWSRSNNIFSMSQIMYLFHYITDRTTLVDILNSKFNILNFSKNNFTEIPTKSDKSLFFYMENIIWKLTNGYNKIIENSLINFSEYLKKNNIIVFLVYVLTGIFAIIYILIETCIY